MTLLFEAYYTRLQTKIRYYTDEDIEIYPSVDTPITTELNIEVLSSHLVKFDNQYTSWRSPFGFALMFITNGSYTVYYQMWDNGRQDWGPAYTMGNTSRTNDNVYYIPSNNFSWTDSTNNTKTEPGFAISDDNSIEIQYCHPNIQLNDDQFYTRDEYEELIGNPIITYTWHSLGSISGAMGVFSLAKIYDADLGDGQPVLNGNLNAIESLPAASSIITLAGGLAAGESKEIMYSGDFYKLKIQRGTQTLLPGVDISSATLKFYLNPTTGGVENLIFSDTVMFGSTLDGTSNVDSYLGIIIDYDNQVAALNIITPFETYVSYNMPGAGMTAEQMHNLYIWVMGGNPEEEGEDPLDSFEDDQGSGGGDLVDRTSNPLPEPGIPSLSAYDTGFLSQYLIGKTAFKRLVRFLMER